MASMTDPEPFPTTSGDLRCSYHPSVETRLRCSRCGKPICPRCGVRTPVGLRCPDCAGVRGLPTYATTPSVLGKAAFYSAPIALLIGFVWGFFPTWQFYLALALGFGVAETMARAANGKRGRDLQFLAMALVAIGLLVSRVVLAQRAGIDLGQINDLTPRLERSLYLRVLPDLLFAVIPFVLGWIRFR